MFCNVAVVSPSPAFSIQQLTTVIRMTSQDLPCLNHDEPSFKCFTVSDLKKKIRAGLGKNCYKDGQWRYSVLGQACCHLGLMEDANCLAYAEFLLESVFWSDDDFSFLIHTLSTLESMLFVFREKCIRSRERPLPLSCFF